MLKKQLVFIIPNKEVLKLFGECEDACIVTCIDDIPFKDLFGEFAEEVKEIFKSNYKVDYNAVNNATKALAEAYDMINMY